MKCHLQGAAFYIYSYVWWDLTHKTFFSEFSEEPNKLCKQVSITFHTIIKAKGCYKLAKQVIYTMIAVLDYCIAGTFHRVQFSRMGALQHHMYSQFSWTCTSMLAGIHRSVINCTKSLKIGPLEIFLLYTILWCLNRKRTCMVTHTQ